MVVMEWQPSSSTSTLQYIMWPHYGEQSARAVVVNMEAPDENLGTAENLREEISLFYGGAGKVLHEILGGIIASELDNRWDGEME